MTQRIAKEKSEWVQNSSKAGYLKHVEKTGILGIANKVQSRYFWLMPEKKGLYVRKDVAAKVPMLSFKLTPKSTCVSAKVNSFLGDFPILLHAFPFEGGAKEEFLFGCATSVERDEWIAAIMNVIADFKPSPKAALELKQENKLKKERAAEKDKEAVKAFYDTHDITKLPRETREQLAKVESLWETGTLSLEEVIQLRPIIVKQGVEAMEGGSDNELLQTESSLGGVFCSVCSSMNTSQSEMCDICSSPLDHVKSEPYPPPTVPSSTQDRPLLEPPPPTSDRVQQGIVSAREAFRKALRDGGAAPWGRSKLMMVGEGRAGKTSTVRSFMNKAFDPHVESTIGADTKSLVVVDRKEKVVNWTEDSSIGDEFSKMASRAAARKLLSEKKARETVTAKRPQEEADVVTRSIFDMLAQIRNEPASGGGSGAGASVTSISSSDVDDAPKMTIRRRSSAFKLVSGIASSLSFRHKDGMAVKAELETPALSSVSFRMRQGDTVVQPPQTELDVFAMDETEVAKRFDVDLMESTLSEENDPSKRPLSLSIWDYGGQQVFYAFHHVFLTKFGAYCVVFDMTRILRGDEDSIILLQFWLRSIRMHAGTAPVFLVGTHKDVVRNPSDFVRINETLERRLRIATNAQVVPNYLAERGAEENLWFFPIDNAAGAEGDPVIQNLREMILESVRSCDYVQMDVPIAWTRVLDVLLEHQKRTQTPHLSLSKVAEIARTCGVTANVTDMLCFFHELGVLCFFDSSTDVRQLVILDPQWLVDAFTKVIRDFKLHKYDMMRDRQLVTSFGEDWEQLQSRGIVSKRLLFESFWEKEEEVNKHFLLSLMKNMSLICEWVEPGSEAAGGKFLVPSLLEGNVATNTLEIISPSTPFEVRAEISFKSFFLPHGLFPRLIALVVSHATTAFENSCTPLLSNTQAFLSFGEAGFLLELRMHEDAIRIDIMHGRFFSLIQENLMSMLDKLRDEVMGKEMKMVVNLLIPITSDKFVAVPMDAVERYQQDRKNKKLQSLWVGSTLVDLRETDDMFVESSGALSVAPRIGEEAFTAFTVPPLVADICFHVFISYSQQTAMDQVQSLFSLLKNKHLRVWYDQMVDTQITETAMMEGIMKSQCVIVFLSKGVLTKAFCLMEIRMAQKMNKPILFVHEEDRRNSGFAEIYDIRNEGPVDLQELFVQIESIPYRRRKHEQEAMVVELGKRVQRACA